jgi:hypothetical protein
VVEHLPSKHEALSSNPVPQGKKRKEKKVSSVKGQRGNILGFSGHAVSVPLLSFVAMAYSCALIKLYIHKLVTN